MTSIDSCLKIKYKLYGKCCLHYEFYTVIKNNKSGSVSIFYSHSMLSKASAQSTGHRTYFHYVTSHETADEMHAFARLNISIGMTHANVSTAQTLKC